MTDIFPEQTAEVAQLRRQLAPEAHEAFTQFSRAVFADGALPRKVKELIAVAVAHAVARTAAPAH